MVAGKDAFDQAGEVARRVKVGGAVDEEVYGGAVVGEEEGGLALEGDELGGLASMPAQGRLQSWDIRRTGSEGCGVGGRFRSATARSRGWG